MAHTEPRGFNRQRFESGLRTRRVGRTLLVRETTGSTNDDAWEALAQGLPDGVTVVADRQTAGRGRAGRSWLHAPGHTLALSVGLHVGCDARAVGVSPLAAGLALAEALAALGLVADLKWPNDVLAGGRKLGGILCERHVLARGDAVVIGVGVNIRTPAAGFPEGIAARATSLAEHGVTTDVEPLAAAFLGALEPWWDELQEGSRARVIEAWSARATFWGRTLNVQQPHGAIEGIAVRLDADGALVLRFSSGVETTVVAGDVALHGGSS